MPSRQHTIAVFNSSEDTTDMLRTWFEHAGFVVVTAFTHALRDGATDLESLMRQHQPTVVVYDIAIPYESNWRLYEHIRTSPACIGTEFVLTSSNAAQVKKIAGSEQDILEIIGKPYDLNVLLDAIRAVVNQSCLGRDRPV